MQRKVEGLENLNNILSLPIGIGPHSSRRIFTKQAQHLASTLASSSWISLWDPWSLTLRSKTVPRHSSSA